MKYILLFLVWIPEILSTTLVGRGRLWASGEMRLHLRSRFETLLLILGAERWRSQMAVALLNLCISSCCIIILLVLRAGRNSQRDDALRSSCWTTVKTVYNWVCNVNIKCAITTVLSFQAAEFISWLTSFLHSHIPFFIVSPQPNGSETTVVCLRL